MCWLAAPLFVFCLFLSFCTLHSICGAVEQCAMRGIHWERLELKARKGVFCLLERMKWRQIKFGWGVNKTSIKYKRKHNFLIARSDYQEFS